MNNQSPLLKEDSPSRKTSGNAEVATPEPIGCCRFEQVSIRVRVFRIHLAQRRDVVQAPESASVRRDNQIVSVDDQIVHRNGWQIQLKRLPPRAVVERNVNSRFGS